ncbi:MAG TPA: MauE/DoxX family redox-associated membrane protein [Trebonia sp.]
MNEMGVLTIAREIQLPLLAVLLIGGCAAKARRPAAASGDGAETGPTAMLPSPLRRPAALALCAIELALGVGLLATAGRAGAGAPAFAVRTATGLLFCTAAGALYELRARRPDAGCGCFGELSRTPVSRRAIARAVLLSAAALSSITLAPLRMPTSAGQAWLTLAVIAAELAVLTALSPEVGQLLLRLSHTDPCELREVPVARTMSALHASASWRRYQPYLVATAPLDVWREGCWRFVVFPAEVASRRVHVVFAVHLADHGDPVRAGLLDADAVVADAALEPDPLQLSNLV